MKSVTPERLREALTCWQTLMYCCEVDWNIHVRASVWGLPFDQKEIEKVSSEVFRWREFEQFVLDNTLQELPKECWVVPEILRGKGLRIEALEHFPLELFAWSRKSRRVYQLPSDLQFAFATATLEKIRWKDVLWPFDSFSIELETPLLVEEDLAKDRWSEYDTLLVSKLPDGAGGNQVVIRLFSNPKDHRHKPFPNEEARLIKRYFAANNLDRVVKTLHRGVKMADNRRRVPQGWRSHVIYDSRATSLEDRVELEAEHFLAAQREKMLPIAALQSDEELLARMDIVSIVAKIAVCWAVYLSKISNPGVETLEVSRARGTRGVTGVITDPQYICSIIGHGVLDPVAVRAHKDEVKAIASSYFVMPHGRRSHFRRPPRSPKNAEKSVEVPAVIVRKDLVPVFGLIGGTVTKVLPEE